MGLIGAYSAHLDRQGASKKTFLTALMFALIVFYFMQTSCYFFWTNHIFPAMHVDDMYFVYSNFLEFFVFIFIRTRTSIKFYAKFITILNISFLVYINSYMYGAQIQFFYMMVTLTFCISLAFLEFFEVPAIRDWNPFHENTPRIASPRIGYQHVMSDSNFGNGFDIW